MVDDKVTVLLVEDAPGDARRILDAFSSSGNGRFRVERVGLLSDAIERLGRGNVEVVLLGLEFGIAAVDQIVQTAPGAIVLALGAAQNDDEDARLSILHGAHDYLAKGAFDARGLPQLLGYVVREKTARDAQRVAEKCFQAMSDTSFQGICITDAKGLCIYSNGAYHKLSGQGAEEVSGAHWSSFVYLKDRQRALATWRQGLRQQTAFPIEFRYLCKGRRIVWVRVMVVPMHDQDRAYGYVLSFEDVTERKIREFVMKATEDALFDEMELVQATLNSISDAVMTIDTHGKVIYMNPSAENMTGWSRDKALGLPVNDVLWIIDSTTRLPVDSPLVQAMRENRMVKLARSSTLVSRNGSEFAIADSSAPIHNAQSSITGAVIVFHQVAEAGVAVQNMHRLAQHDILTGLPNRWLLIDRLDQAIKTTRRQGKQLAALYLGIDDFEHINSSLGSLVVDQLLQSVASRLVSCLRGVDTVSRLGSDEFAVLLAEIESPRDAIQIAEKLLASIFMPHVIDAHVLHVSLSIGIAIYPDDDNDQNAILRNAEMAMRQAQDSRRNSFQFFKAEMNEHAVSRMDVERSLRRALKNEEFVLHYQPQYSFASGAITGAEALLRWQDPEKGLILPAQFIRIAEESGLIVPIGQWVLREACRQLQTWVDAGLNVVPMAVNISPVEFRSSRFVEGVTLILQQTGIATRYLGLELAESIVLRNAKATATTLEKLHELGLSLTIDAFGTGYANLGQLGHLPVSAWKIAKSFVDDIAINPDNANIVGSIIAMGQNLKQQVIAKGVETREQFSILQARHCNEGQGFHFSQPLPAEDFGDLLRGNGGSG
jgi:diguanylate cyclase (GGDEF)-like protein/PAS domain S-box-containing protein